MHAEFILPLQPQTAWIIATPSKKRKALTLEEKVKVIRLNEKGKSVRRIAAELDVGKTQIASIVKSRDKVLQQLEGCADSGRKILKARRYQHHDLNAKVYEWFLCGPFQKHSSQWQDFFFFFFLLFKDIHKDDYIAQSVARCFWKSFFLWS